MAQSVSSPRQVRSAARTSAPHRVSSRRPAPRLVSGSVRVQAGSPSRIAPRPPRHFDSLTASCAPGSRSVRSAPVPVTMRLTRRGRALLVVLVMALTLVVFSLGRATSHAADSGAPITRPTTVVQSGETLWQVARRVAPREDPRVTIERILKLNDLAGAHLVRAGQQLILPS